MGLIGDVEVYEARPPWSDDVFTLILVLSDSARVGHMAQSSEIPFPDMI